MLQDSKLLRTPGPTPIPPSIQRAMNQPMIGHRSGETKELLGRIQPKLKSVFGTEEDVMLMTGSGTSGLEAAVVNLAAEGDEVLVVVTGAFGDRLATICETYHLRTHRLEFTWGQAADPDQIKAFLQQHPHLKAVFLTYCETSTGVLNPVQSISKVVRDQSDALVIVDGVSCIGGVTTQMDAWGIDLLVTGSQKALMLPPGLTFIAASQRAWHTIEANKQARFYLDLRQYREQLASHATPFTPGLSLLFGLEASLTLMEEEGLNRVYERHETMAKMLRAAMKALDVPLLTKDQDASPTVTAIQPKDVNAESLRAQVKQKFGLELAGGQQHLKNKLIRVGHMGYCAPKDILQMAGLLELGLQLVGKSVVLGSGVAAAQEIYLQRERELA
ncbi:alanine--glyoxylate aminotransferase family protein [Barrientosiimonas marina]|uniref:Pyridoxal-phosphate-dependent aminotransferase family protein n=1 Tax=Lentibacillus kimchii TaxID=1542911 RepID=A0ABW2UTP5_9BACI